MGRGFKVRLDDGSEVGPLDDKMLYSWYEQGLIDDGTPVQGAGVQRWTPLSDAIDVTEWKAAKRGGRPKAGKARAKADEEEEAETWEEEPIDRPTRWRTLVAALLLLAGAAGAGFLYFFPERWTPALRPVPWRDVALGQLLIALVLFPGWELGRRLARVLVFLAAFAVFPLAGILIAQGLRGMPLLVLLSAWLLASGLFAFLSGPALSVPKAIVALLIALAGATGVAYFGVLQQGDELDRLRTSASLDGHFRDESAGLAVEAPSPWLVLRPDASLVGAPAGARLRLADPASSTRAALLVESPSRAYLSLDDYLSRVADQRRREVSSWRESGRSDATVGRHPARRLAAAWAGEGAFEEKVVAWKNGWTYYALVAWTPPARSEKAAGEVDALLRGITVDGQLGTRLQQAVETVVREVPHLSAAAAEMLMGQSAAQVLEPAEAFRRSFELAGRGLPSLARGEVKELGDLTALAYALLSRPDRARLGAYIDRVRGRLGTSPDEDREMSQLMKGAVLGLRSSDRSRLQALFEKALGAALRTS